MSFDIMAMGIWTQVIGELHSLQILDLLTITTLAALEGILSVDNALVLALLVRTLPEKDRKKALTYGIVGAFFFRFVALILAAHLMELVIFKFIGGGYLIYLAMKHMFFFNKEDASLPGGKKAAGFWRTVFVVELTDIAFSIDSITTAVAMTDKLTVVWVGGVLGIIFLRFAAGLFVRLLEKLPTLEDLAYQLVFFIGTKLTLEGFHIEIEHSIFWMMMGVIAILGSALVYRDYYQRSTRTKHHNRLLERLEHREIDPDELFELEYIPGEVVKDLRDRGWIELHIPKDK